MLSRAHRLTSARDFVRVSRRGRPVFGPHLSVRAVAQSDPNAPSRIGIVVGLKVSKLATKRNLLKRRIREAVRALLPRLESGADAVIHPKPSAVDCGYRQLADEIRMVFQRVGLLR